MRLKIASLLLAPTLFAFALPGHALHAEAQAPGTKPKIRAKKSAGASSTTKRFRRADVAVRVMRAAKVRWAKGKAKVRSLRRYHTEKGDNGGMLVHFQ